MTSSCSPCIGLLTLSSFHVPGCFVYCICDWIYPHSSRSFFATGLRNHLWPCQVLFPSRLSQSSLELLTVCTFSTVIGPESVCFQHACRLTFIECSDFMIFQKPSPYLSCLPFVKMLQSPNGMLSPVSENVCVKRRLR